MKTIKVHIATEPYSYTEIEFDSYEEYLAKYTEFYVQTKLLAKESYKKLPLKTDNE